MSKRLFETSKEVWRKGGFYFLYVKILGDECGSFGGLKSLVFYFDFGVVANKRSCGSEVDRSLSRGKIQRQSNV